jgi:hypothetical protein
MAGPFYSDQITNLDQTTPRKNVQPNELGGRLRVAHFAYKTPAAGAPAVGEIVQLTRLPKGARVLAIFVQNEALSSAAGTAGADVGDAGDADRFVAAYDMDAAHSVFLTLRTDTVTPPVLGYGYETTAELTLTMTVTGEAFAVSKYIRGHVEYCVD